MVGLGNSVFSTMEAPSHFLLWHLKDLRKEGALPTAFALFVYSDPLPLLFTSPTIELFFNVHSLHASQKHISLVFILKTLR